MNVNKDTSIAYRLQDGRLAMDAPEAYFPFLESKGHVISLVGGGGKTTLLYYLAERCSRRGMRTAVMTTTKMGLPETSCQTMEQCFACWKKGTFAVCGEPFEGRRLNPPAGGFLGQLLEEADMVLIEADGARRLPCKAPAAHEPVILPQTDVVIAVMGLDALGKPVEETCLRADIVQRLLGCGAQHQLTCEDMAHLLLSDQGSRKGVEHRDFYVVLNKCDDEQRLADGTRILQLLKAQGQERAMLTVHKNRSERYELRPQKRD